MSRAKLLQLAEWEPQYRPFEHTKPTKPHTKRLTPNKARTIDNPSEELKSVQAKILKRLLLPVELPGFLFGAVPHKSIRDHAKEHIGATTVLKMDIKSYYPNVTSHHVYSVWRSVLGCSPEVARLLTQLTTCNYHLPQGAPTSPALANLFLASIYTPVLAACSDRKVTASAWVDDLTFSGTAVREVIEIVRQVLAANGFKDSRRKRALLGPRDAKMITGVRLGKNGTRACRTNMGEIRAGIYNLSRGRVTAKGLQHDLQSLQGKVTHINTLCATDAQKLQRELNKVKADKLRETSRPVVQTSEAVNP